jgi:hypothetical protein
MKAQSKKALLLIFLGLTVGLAAFLCYTIYVWIGVGNLLRSLDDNTTIDNMEISTQNNTTSMNATITITNCFAGSYIKIYIAIKALTINGKTPISLYDLYEGQLPGTFGNIYISPLSNASIKLSFNLPSDSLKTEDLQNLTLNIRILATTVVNEGRPQTIDFEKRYRAL